MKKALFLAAFAALSLSASAVDYYIIGANVNGKGWELAAPDAKFTDNGNGTFTWTGQILGTGFKVNDGTWSNPDVNFGTNGSKLVIGEDYTYAINGDNIALDGVTEVANPTVVLNPSAGTIRVSGAGSGSEKWYFTGDFNDWGFTNELVANGSVFELKGVALPAESEFKVTTTGWGEQYGGASSGAVITDSQLSTVLYQVGATDGATFSITAGNYDIVWNYETKTVTFSRVGGPVIPGPDPTVPEALYILGNINGGDWNPAEGVEMTKNGNVFTAEDVVLQAPENDFAWFSFATAIGADWDADVNSSDRYGAEAGDTPIANGGSAKMVLYAAGVNASAAAAWKIPAGTYTITANFDTMTVSINGTTGVKNIELDAAEAVYFNLQGQRVANPDKGMYLKVVNGKAAKVVL